MRAGGANTWEPVAAGLSFNALHHLKLVTDGLKKATLSLLGTHEVTRTVPVISVHTEFTMAAQVGVPSTY